MISVFLSKQFRGRNHMPFRIDVKFGLDKDSRILALTGVSGSGKTSILRMISGLLDPDQGRINVNDEVWYDSEQKINLPVQKRKIGFVFQDYALFPHMTVRQNIEFALSDNSANRKVGQYLELTGLSDFINHKPGALSGGQQQRVALVRALLRDPSILLLDEPLSALDEDTRSKMQDTLGEIFEQLGIPVILVSHSKSEVEKLADAVVVVEHGKIS